MKRMVWVALIFVLLITFPIPTSVLSSSESVIRLQINSKELWTNGKVEKEMDVAPFVLDNRTWVPVRFISEALGASVYWNGDLKQVTINLDGKTIVLIIDSKTLLVNGNPVLMDVAPFIKDNRTWVPIRFVAENLGGKVSWVQGSREVLIRKGAFSGPTVAYVKDGSLVMAEVRDQIPQEKKVLVDGGVSGPIAWSANGLKVAYYLVEKLPQGGFNLTLEFCVESSGERVQFLYQENIYGNLKPLSWEIGGEYLLYDEPSIEFSGTLFEVAPGTGQNAQLGDEGTVVYGLYSPNGVHMAWMVNDEEGFSVQVWDLDGLILQVPGEIWDFAFSSEGSLLALSTSQGIEIYDLTDPSLPPVVFTLKSSVFNLLWSPNDKLIAASDSEGGVIGLDIATGDAIPLDLNPGSRPAGFLPSGDVIIEHPMEYYLGGSTYYLHEMETDTIKLFLEGAEFLSVRPN